MATRKRTHPSPEVRLCRLVGGCGQEGDLYDAKAHEMARAAIARAEEV